jgi:hypothetical protein
MQTFLVWFAYMTTGCHHPHAFCATVDADSAIDVEIAARELCRRNGWETHEGEMQVASLDNDEPTPLRDFLTVYAHGGDEEEAESY